jgi:hypothetical protein
MESWTGRYVQQQSSLIVRSIEFGFVVEDLDTRVKVYWRNIYEGQANEKTMEKADLTIADTPSWDFKNWVETKGLDKIAREAKAKESRIAGPLTFTIPHDETRLQEVRIYGRYVSPRLCDRFDELNTQCFNSELPSIKIFRVKQIEGDLVDGGSVVVKNLVVDAGGLFVPAEHSPFGESFICLKEDTPAQYEDYALLHEMTHAKVHPADKKHGTAYLDELTRALNANGWEVLGCKDRY